MEHLAKLQNATADLSRVISLFHEGRSRTWYVSTCLWNGNSSHRQLRLSGKYSTLFPSGPQPGSLSDACIIKWLRSLQYAFPLTLLYPISLPQAETGLGSNDTNSLPMAEAVLDLLFLMMEDFMMLPLVQDLLSWRGRRIFHLDFLSVFQPGWWMAHSDIAGFGPEMCLSTERIFPGLPPLQNRLGLCSGAGQETLPWPSLSYLRSLIRCWI